jgi:hypothetical protein
MSMKFAFYSALAFVILQVARADDGAIYARAQRQERIHASLEAMRASPPEQLENLDGYLSSVARGACRSNDDSLRVACLEDHARRNCASVPGSAAKARCAVLSDLVVVNRLNEKQFVSREERIGNQGAAYTKLLARKQALLVTELLLLSQASCPDDGVGCLSEAIDDYCLKNADQKGVPWQGCVAAITWFMGTSR